MLTMQVMGEVEPIVHIRQRVDDLCRTTDTSFQQVHATLVEIRKYAERQPKEVVEWLRNDGEASYQAKLQDSLRTWDNRRIGRVIFAGSLAATFTLFLVLRKVMNPGTLTMITRLLMFGTASVTGLVLLWGSAFNDIRHSDAMPWTRLRVRGKVLVLATILSLACTVWTILSDRQAFERQSQVLGEVHEAAAAALGELKDVDDTLRNANKRLEGLPGNVTALFALLAKISGQLEPLSKSLDKQAALFQNQLGAATKQLSKDLETIRTQVSTIASASDTIANIQKSTDAIGKVKEATDKIGDIIRVTDNIDGKADKIAKAVVASDDAGAIVSLEREMRDLKRLVGELKSKIDNPSADKGQDKKLEERKSATPLDSGQNEDLPPADAGADKAVAKPVAPDKQGK